MGYSLVIKGWLVKPRCFNEDGYYLALMSVEWIMGLKSWGKEEENEKQRWRGEDCLIYSGVYGANHP